MLTIKLSAFMFSLWGNVRNVQRLLRFPSSLSWLFTISFLGLVLYFATLINVLVLVTYGLFVLELLGGSWALLTVKPQPAHQWTIQSLLPIGLLLFLFLVPAFYSKFTHYDDFSYWALIVKYLFIENELPRYGQSLIVHYAYPPGSATFYYYLAKIIGFQEGILLMGHGLMYLVSLLTGISLIRKDRHNHWLSMMILTLFILIAHYSMPLNSLLVDIIIATIPLGALIGLWYYRDDFLRASIYLGVVLGYVTIVKNSALLFTMVVFAIYVGLFSYRWYQQQVWSQPKLWGFGGVAVVILTPIVTWLQYVKLRYGSLRGSKHSMSVTSYQEIFDEKDPTIIKEITAGFIKELINWNNWRIIATVSIFLIFIVIMIGLHVYFQMKLKPFLYILGIGGLVLGVYTVGLYLMYLFSMPVSEALSLAGFNRYWLTVLIFITGLFISFIIMMIQSIDVQLPTTSVIMTMLVFVIVISMGKTFVQQAESSNYSEAEIVKEKIGEVYTVNDERVLLISSKEKKDIQTGYEHYLSRYYLMSSAVDVRQDFDVDDQELKVLVNDYDQIIYLKEDSIFEQRYHQYLTEESSSY